MTYKIMIHENQHGYGVSMVKYGPLGTLVSGFVLNTFETEIERDTYVREFLKFRHHEVEAL